MSLWHWVRSRRWWWQLAIASVALPLGLSLVYVAGRSLQYVVADKDAGLFAPASVHATLRLRDLEGQLDRLEASFAWRTIDRRILRDAAVRPRLNAALKDAGLPTLDDLSDPRKSGQYSRDNLLRAAGRDLVAGVAAPDAWKGMKFCAATRLRWSDYLLTPFAPLVLQDDGGLRRSGKLWIAFSGAIAIVGNDRALVDEARRGRGRPPEGTRPAEAVVRFDGSRPLQALREELRQRGLLPHVNVETAKALRFSVDLDGSVARFDAVLEGVVPAYPGQSPPNAFLERAPAATTGVFSTSGSLRDIYARVKPQAPASKVSNVAQAIEQLERGGMSERLLPLLDPGVAVITGTQENEGKLFPCVALLLKASDPEKVSEALYDLVMKIGGPQAKKNHDASPVGDTRLHSVTWPGALGEVNDFFLPCWAVVEGGLLFGNNRGFAEAVIAAGSGGDLWKDRRTSKRLRLRMKELGFAAEPGMAGGVLLPPQLKESLDGVIQWFSRVAALPEGDTALRQELEREWAQQGRSALPGPEKDAIFHETRKARIQEFEAELRRGLRGLDPLRWAAFESAPVPGGVSLKLAIGFDSLTDR